mmetsp:Transcript_48572/g.155415  ORF Transcript_48572/g.155415 Transcript_48572/m.155415 type:complete len:148 (-) Transcript_48572:473-916(-)
MEPSPSKSAMTTPTRPPRPSPSAMTPRSKLKLAAAEFIAADKLPSILRKRKPGEALEASLESLAGAVLSHDECLEAGLLLGERKDEGERKVTPSIPTPLPPRAYRSDQPGGSRVPSIGESLFLFLCGSLLTRSSSLGSSRAGRPCTR